MTHDGIFFINNALRVNQLSVFSDRTRFLQIMETIDSINHYCPNNRKFIFDSSPLEPDKTYIEELAKTGTTVFYMGQEPNVKALSENGIRSLAESITFITFIQWFKTQNIPGKRIYKLSGRYCLNSKFVINEDRYTNSFVFAKSHDSWMTEEERKEAGVDRLFPLRLWHMDYNLLDSFEKELDTIIHQCAEHGLDVEHAYYKQLHKYNVIELDKIGVDGRIAPNGEFIDE